MALEIKIHDNTTYVTIEYVNVDAPSGSKSIDLPKNACILQVVNNSDMLNIICEGLTPIMIDYNLVTLPAAPHDDALDLRGKVVAYFYK